MNNVKYLSCETSQTIGDLTYIHKLIHDPLYQNPNPLHTNLSRQVTSHQFLCQTSKLKNHPQIATEETKLFSKHYFGTDANSYIGILPPSHFYKDLNCLKNVDVSQGKGLVDPLLCVAQARTVKF